MHPKLARSFVTISPPPRQNERREMLLRELADDLAVEVIAAVEASGTNNPRAVGRDVARLRLTDAAGRLTTLLVEAVERREGGRSIVYAGVGELPTGRRE